MNLIQKALERKRISPSQARAVETFIVSTVISFGFLVLDNLDKLLSWQSVDRRDALIVFSVWVSASITMWVRKRLRDKTIEFME